MSSLPVKIRIPSALRQWTQHEAVVNCEGSTVGTSIQSLFEKFPDLKDQLLDGAGEVRRFINVYLNEEDIRFLKGLETALKPGDEISIMAAIAGG